MEGWLGREKELGNANWQTYSDYEDVRYGMAGIVNNVEKAKNSVRWTLDPSRGAFYKLYRYLPTVL